jgi:hypothetical protein
MALHAMATPTTITYQKAALITQAISVFVVIRTPSPCGVDPAIVATTATAATIKAAI